MHSPSKKAICLAAFLYLALFFWVEAFAQRINDANYRYPYQDPWVATSTVALMEGNETIPSVTIKDLQIRILNGRDRIFLLEGEGKLRYRFYQQERPAPLIFIIPGFGSSAYSGSARYLAELLAGEGFHVLVLPSPFSWNFTLAASRSGTPGLTREDAKDLYGAMQLILNALKEQEGATIGKIGLLGFSEGALDAGYIAKLDAEQRIIGIDTYLLINPPVDALKAVKRIDAMIYTENKYGKRQRSYLEAYAAGVLVDALHNDPNNPDFFADWDSRTRLTDRQFEYLIGNEFQKSLGDVIYTSNLIYNPGILKSPVTRSFRSARFAEARSYTLTGYIKTFLIPRIRQLGDKEMSIEKLNAQNSLKAIETTLENNQQIFLMHNLDDLLVSGEDIAYLKKVFGDRAKFYPHGGHLGNLWYPENKKDILNIFKPLLASSPKFVKQ
jgi:hypothetical protein